MTEEEESRAISQLIERLAIRFPQLRAETVKQAVAMAQHKLEGARIRIFVPLLVEHDALAQLKEIPSQADPPAPAATWEG